MSATGPSISDECIKAFENMKKRDGATPEEDQKRKKAVLFRLNEDNSQVVVDAGKEILVGSAGEDPYQRFIDMLPEGDCRFAVYSAAYVVSPSLERESIVFILWTPKNAPVRSQMIYPSTKDALRKKLVGIVGDMQATSREDLSRQALAKKLTTATVVKLDGKSL